MDNKFGSELDKIEKLLNKVDIDLNTDFTKVDFSTFFKNVDKTFEIYNICLEELCGQLYLLEFPMHSKVVRKLYHHYKHQLYNIMKFQLNLQREINEKAEEDKNTKIKLEVATAKLAKTTDKKRRLKQTVEEQRVQIESLNISLSAQMNRQLLANFNKNTSRETVENVPSGQNQNDASKSNPRKSKTSNQGKTSSKESNLDFDDDFADNIDDAQINDLLNQNVENEHSNNSREYVLKLLKDIEGYRREINDLKSNKLKADLKNLTTLPENSAKQDQTSSIEQSKKKPVLNDISMNTSAEFVTMNEYRTIVHDLDQASEELEVLKNLSEEREKSYKAKQANDCSEINTLTEEMERSKETIIYLEQISKKNQETTDNLEDLIAKQNITLAEVKDENQLLTRIIQKCETRISELENINSTLKDELKDIESNLPHYENNYEKMKSLSHENLELSKKIDQLEELEQNRDVVVDQNVQKLLEVKTKKIEKLEAEMQKLLKNGKIYSKKIGETEERFKIANKNLNDMTSKNAELLKTNLGLKVLVQNMSKKLEHLNPKLTEKRRTIATGLNMLHVDSDQNRASQRISNEQQNIDEKNDIGEIMKQVENIMAIQNQQEKAISQTNIERMSNLQEKTKNNVDNEQMPKSSKTISGSEKDMQDKIEDQSKISRDEFFEKLGKQSFEQVEDYLHQYLSQDQIEVQIKCVPKLENGMQTDYFSAIDFIIEKEEEVRYNEADLERIKEAADILADMIGFTGIQDYAAVVNGLEQNELNQQQPEKENKKFSKIKEVGLNKDHQKFKIQKNDRNTKIVIKRGGDKNAVGKKDHKEDGNFLDIELKESQSIFKIPKKKTMLKAKIDKNERPEDMESDDDYIVQKSKLIRNNMNKNETVEVVEYIRIPRELNICKPNLPVPKPDNLTELDHNDQKRITGLANVTYQQTLVDKEKLYFRIYLNIKQRYQFKPDRFVTIYKLTFNKVPVFENRIGENYDPKAFLFNFSEFKEYFAEMISNHQACGPDCVHFSRFYKKTGIVGEKNNFGSNAGNNYIQELPKLLEETI